MRKLLASLESDLMDDLLECLLKALGLAFWLDEPLRRSIAGFRGRYVFRSESGEIAASALFDGEEMKVEESAVADADVTVVFKDGRALWEFLTSKDPDVFAFVVESKLTFEGNLNYLLKFSYLARHLEYLVTP